LDGSEVFVGRIVVIENLDFHAGVGGIAASGGADADAIVGGLGELEFELKIEIAVFLVEKQIPTVGGGAVKNAILGRVSFYSPCWRRFPIGHNSNRSDRGH
jgi:hypothetical protein